MDIIHIMNQYLERHLGHAIQERLRVMPAVVITGARQTGKSTLVRDAGDPSRKYMTLDDLDTLDAAQQDPQSLVGGSQPLTLDEVQREPRLLVSVKREIDRGRRPGQFLITGSANLLLMRRSSESLAGRAVYLTLWPMTRGEQRGLGTCGIWEELLAKADLEWPDVLSGRPDTAEDWRSLARRGGFPDPVLHMISDRDRAVWFDGYVQTYLERDIRDLSSISSLPEFRRLMRAASLRVGQILNQTDMGRELRISQPTVSRWLDLLETSYMLVRLPAYSVNRTKRLIKSPRTYWSDTGLALHLAAAEPDGAHMENVVLSDLLVWRDARSDRAEVFYWRTTTGEEVDFVIEAGDKLIPIEVKAASRVNLRDVQNLRLFRREYGQRSRMGLLLYTGSEVKQLAPDVLAVPWWKVL